MYDTIVEVNGAPLDLDALDDDLYTVLKTLPRPIEIGFQRFTPELDGDEYSIDNLL